MKRILVPTDFSSHAYYAAEIAAGIAKKTEARVFLLHVVSIPVYEENYTFREMQNVTEGIYIMKLVKQQFEEMIKAPFFKGVNVVEALQFENVYETITDQALKHEIDLIVMGSHGASGLNEVFIGSNTEKVVRLAHCPVLTVKSKHESFKVENLVFASDFSQGALDAFDKLSEFIDLYNPKIHLLKVITPNQFETSGVSKKQLEDFASARKLKNCSVNIYNHETVEQGILEFAAGIEADLVAMPTHGRTGISHLINGSLTEDVVNHAARPVISIRMK